MLASGYGEQLRNTTGAQSEHSLFPPNLVNYLTNSKVTEECFPLAIPLWCLR